MFIDDEEEKAANVEEVENSEVEAETTEQPTSPVEEPVDQTKAFATRLKEEKAKAKLEAKEEIAHSFGYGSWEEYSNAQTQNKLLDKGIDPESALPVLKELVKEDPEFKAAQEKAAKYEELEKEMFATNSIKALNEKFGTSYKSVNELDPETVDMWNKGTPLEKAFAANNWEKISEMAVKKASSKENTKAHLKTVEGSGEHSNERQVSADEISVAKAFGFTEEQLKEHIKSAK